jgi:hypothetical protein
MAYTLEVKYFNSFWLKKVISAEETQINPNTTATTIANNKFPRINAMNYGGKWPGLPWNPRFINSEGVSIEYATSCPWPFGSGGVVGSVMPSGSNTPGLGGPAGHWVVEEARIKGGFNNSIVSLGVRAYSVNEINEQVDRSNSLIFSGVFNDRTGSNQTNVFSVSGNIIKDANPLHGSIQKLYSEDSNLLVFQENKVNTLLVNKSTVYSGEQGAEEALGQAKVLGQLVPYLGEYGISQNPESFAIFGYRKYFADKDRAAILRLSRDGITEISGYGMRDYFRDYLATISSEFQRTILTKSLTGLNVGAITTFSITGSVVDVEIGSQVEIDGIATGNIVVNAWQFSPLVVRVTMNNTYSFLGNTTATFVTYRRDKAIGGYDIHNQCYTVSMQRDPRIISTASDTFATVSFDEMVQGWTSFYSYKPVFLGSLKNKFYSFIDNSIYEHYYQNPPLNNTRCKFYGATTPDDANITFIFNPDTSVSKNFNTIGYEGANGWEVDFFTSDFQGIDPDLPVSTSSTYSNINQYQDVISTVRSYDEGRYTVDNVTKHAGFDRKENKYVANLVSSSVARPGEVIFGSQVSGIKGFFATVKLSIDGTTDPGGMKELYSVSSNYVMSSY